MRRASMRRRPLHVYEQLTGRLLAIAAAAMFCAGAFAAAAAQPFEAPKPVARVMYVAEAQTVPAGRRGVLELHFKVAPGFHVNSHTPKSELLIPTRLDVKPAAGVKEEAAQYPAGKEYSFSFDPATKLDVYSEDFTVRLPVVASAGEHAVEGTLHYQACDKAACYPPKNLDIEVLFTAK